MNHIRGNQEGAAPTDDEIAGLMNNALDITGAELVDVSWQDGVLWVNVNGICVLRVCRIRKLVTPAPNA